MPALSTTTSTAGTSSGVTVSDVLDRLFREWLTRPESQQVSTTLTTAAAQPVSTLTFDADMLSIEETNLLTEGTIVEVGRSLYRVTAFDGVDTLTVQGPVLGSHVADHNSGDTLRVQPEFTRSAAFDALADTVDELHPPLFSVNETQVAANGSYVEAPADATGIQSVIGQKGSSYFTVPARLEVNFPPSSTGKAFFFKAASGVTCYVTYRGDLARPTAESDVLVDLGVRESWQELLMVGALGALVAAGDIDRAATEYLTAKMELEATPVGTGMQLSRMIDGQFARLRHQARSQLAREYKLPVSRNGWTVTR